MCNACGFYCCATDSFDGCGCDCPEADCRLARCSFCGTQFESTLQSECPHCFPEGSDQDEQ
jgi:hypothetical protein